MTPKEQEIAIGEVEERVDRLRILYDQYFLGFEKLEPTVPRKDVERRIAILRKEQIRNTALRFRFNVVTQKYNTYGMYWIRIARQIEEGTFKRHLRKAEARFGGRRERDMSIDVDLTDFEIDMDAEMDMDSVLAEANAAAEAYARDGDSSDTLPPPPTSERGPSSVRMPAARPMLLNTPGTSFVVGGRREVIDEPEPHTPAPDSIRIGERTARPAQLPVGSKPRVVLRKVAKGPDSEPGAAGPSSVRTPAPQTTPGHRPRMESSPGLPPPSQSGQRIAPSAAGPAGPRAPGAPGSSPSAGRLPVAAPLPAPSERRIPVAPGSERRLPVPASAPGMPARPAIGKIGAAQPAPPPAQSSGRTPAAAPSRPNAPASQPGAPPPKPAARPSIPDEHEKDTIPPGPSSGAASRPSMPPRSKAPLPLPSQLKKK